MSTMATFRATRVLRGQYSRMLDLGGGAPSAKTAPIRTVDGARNCKVQLVAFDFNVITNSLDEKEKATIKTTNESKETSTTLSPVSVLVDKVQEIASLLNVNLGDTKETPSKVKDEDEDLSALIGHSEKKPAAKEIRKDLNDVMPYSVDVRSKYAEKLKSKGGLASVVHAKKAVEQALSKGDAAGHLAARAAAVSQTAGETKWMALTGTGSLLTYISNRSMKIALLPIPSKEPNPNIGKKMKDFTNQLSLVSFDLLVDKGEDATTILHDVQKEFNIAPVATMVVTDRDDYLRAAKESGMVACRIRPKNARRGNISAHYNVETVGEVQDVVNELNGISFQATRAAGQRY